MIRHTVSFRLKHSKGSIEEKRFFDVVEKLSSISTVKNFECLRQISPKTNFDFGISMEFENKAAYDFYSNHPDHLRFVQDTWLKEVDDFLEIDYEPLNISK